MFRNTFISITCTLAALPISTNVYHKYQVSILSSINTNCIIIKQYFWEDWVSVVYYQLSQLWKPNLLTRVWGANHYNNYIKILTQHTNWPWQPLKLRRYSKPQLFRTLPGLNHSTDFNEYFTPGFMWENILMCWFVVPFTCLAKWGPI